MARRESVWTRKSPYGKYKGPRGNPSTWRALFEDMLFSRDRALGVLKDCPQSPRDILGVSLEATMDEVKAAWRRLVLKHHPDHGGDRREFEKVMAAYSLLVGQ